MTNEMLENILRRYDLDRPVPTFLRHNENRTYRVQDRSGNKYLLRVHDPFVPGMAGLQHRFDGIVAELDMLEHWGRWNEREVQVPVRNREGGLVTTFEENGRKIHASLLTWLEGRDLVKNDLPYEDTIRKLGEQLANLHAFFGRYEPVGLEARPHQGRAYNDKMAGVIRSGAEKGLFAAGDADTIEETLRLVNDRLTGTGSEGPGLIHGDIGLANTILTESGEVRFIDFGFYGRGYALTDTAMGVMMLPADWRRRFLEVYSGGKSWTEADLRKIDGFMLVAIIGYYVFQFGNAKMHDWMRERMPMLCREYCLPFLAGEPMLERIGF
ncbi:phosphotransferase enzyme family protein [Saccharibacillus alkalitolerans]|uniref:Phosphotransferase n=1 Tax=Saccharibacillus alkalitolerans TaxID=2705290 RepID=A0ABX0FAG4_9BACL|nr:phosphotransferase [Saccharibacillus alkalitolerans]NGZ76950.1 phosphotransferase [Saccharibacillus alkalitolerans]